MIIAPCPACGSRCVVGLVCVTTDLQLDHQATCDAEPMGCGYSGPRGKTLDEAVRRHNKISQNCGAA
jgi:hypothetical protein